MAATGRLLDGSRSKAKGNTTCVAYRLSTQVHSGSRCLSPVEQTLLQQVLRTLGLTGCILYCPSGERITEHSARSTKWIVRPMFAISAPAGVVTPPRPRRRDSCPRPRACSISWYGVEPSTSVRVDARRGRISRMDQDSAQRCNSAVLLTYTVWTNIFSNTKSTNHLSGTYLLCSSVNGDGETANDASKDQGARV